MDTLSGTITWDDFRSRLAEVFPPLGPGDGVSEAEVAAAEGRLGFRLPRFLREYYLLAGGRKDLNQSYHHLVAPEDLEVHEGVLVVMEENENVSLWGVPVAEVGQDDPPVVRAENTPHLEWEDDSDRLSQFLLTMLYLQAVHGGMPYIGAVAIDETMIPEVHRHWHCVERAGAKWHEVLVFHKEGQVLCILGRAPELELYAGGRTAEDFRAITDRLKVVWEYSSRAPEGVA